MYIISPDNLCVGFDNRIIANNGKHSQAQLCVVLLVTAPRDGRQPDETYAIRAAEYLPSLRPSADLLSGQW